MLKCMLAAGAAALAIASPAVADPKGNKGGGNEHAGQAAKAQKGGGGKSRGDGDQAARGKDRVQFAQRGDDKPKGGQGKAKAADRGDQGKNAMKVDSRGNDRVRAVRIDSNGKVKVRGGNDRDVKVVRIDRGNDVRIARINRDFDGVRFAPGWNERGLSRGFVDGCPPGLAKKYNGCMPPGQAKKLVGTPLAAALRASMLGGPYRQWYRDDDRFMYRWDDDYIYRVQRDGGLIDALFPYANRDYYYYPVGMQYPDSYNFYNVPYQYQGFYPDGGNYAYRYGDGAIYQVNPTSGLIQGIAALLTGAPMSIGQPLPPAYGVYNVPFDYRTQYYDTPDSMYRYNDGYIYRVDPTTQLITAIISAIV